MSLTSFSWWQLQEFQVQSIGIDWQLLLADFLPQFYLLVVDLYCLNLLPETDKIPTEIWKL